MTLCILAPVPVVLLIAAAFWKPMSTMFHRVGQKWARFHMHLNESLTGIRVVKAFAQEDHENDKFAAAQLGTARRRDHGRHALVHDLRRHVAVHQPGRADQLDRGRLHGLPTRTDHWATSGCSTPSWRMIYMPLQWFGQLNNWFSRAMAGAERIFEVMDTETENYGKDDAAAHAIVGEVEFDNVRFGYDKSNPVLKGLTFTAKPGEMIGLVGKSGAGKSTTINLLCRFYEPDAGTLKIDGMDYRDISLQDMRHQIGIVLQEPFLFNGTVAENIAYGKPGASFEEIMEAAKAANAHNFILAQAGRLRHDGGRARRASCPAASASASPSPAPSCTTRAS